MQPFKILSMLTLICLFSSVIGISPVKAVRVEVDLTGVADHIVDGDTFYIVASNGTEYRIRLADVNASEFGQVGYAQAKENLTSLVYGKTVYLDVDDIYMWDNRGAGNRLVCVPYVEYNSTHLLNVCEALFQAGQVEKKNYDNEFSPYTWSLYVTKKEAVPEIPSAAILSLILIIMFVFALVCSKLIRRIHITPQSKKQISASTK